MAFLQGFRAQPASTLRAPHERHAAGQAGERERDAAAAWLSDARTVVIRRQALALGMRFPQQGRKAAGTAKTVAKQAQTDAKAQKPT